jgi:small basic protein (TIGR04137 family)
MVSALAGNSNFMDPWTRSVLEPSVRSRYNRAFRTGAGARLHTEDWENDDMTMDKSLQLRAGLVRSRSVLSRGERIARLQASDKWQQGQSPLGLPKVRVYKLSMKKKKKRKEEEGEGEVAAAATATPEKKPEKKAEKKK